MPAGNPTAYMQTMMGPIPLKTAEVTQSKTKKGDTFRACSALYGPGVDQAFWSTATSDQAAVQIIVNGTTIFDGVVDHVDMDDEATSIEWTGRDKASKLIDKVSSQKFLNQNPEQVVQTLAQKAGLQANVDSGGGQAGNTFVETFDAMTHRKSHWTVINDLADLFGMNAYITGGQLYWKDLFESLPVLSVVYVPPTPSSYAIGNFMKLKRSRNLILAKTVKTTVNSHNHKTKKLVTSSVSSSGGSDTLNYTYSHHPGLNQDQADRVAKKKHAENTRHEFSISLEMPGDETVNARMSLSLSGTGSAFDQSYEIDSVAHSIGFEGGYRMTIEAKTGKATS